MHHSANDASADVGPLRYSVVVPVFNEAANIGDYCRKALAELPPGFELLICYDFDADSTLPALAAVPADEKPPNIRLVKNDLGKGVRYAIDAGMRAAKAPVVVVMMADLSDDFSKVAEMVSRAEAGADVVCASRYMRGGKQIGGPFLKGLMSRTAGVSLHWLTGLPTHDPTNSFKAYRKEFLERTPIESTAGFVLGLELTAKAHVHGGRVEQVPATWHDRTAGESRFQIRKWLPLYLRWYFWALGQSLMGGRLLRLLLLALLFVVTFPPLFRLPGLGIDDSWAFALNWSAAHGAEWGKDTGFTYGPLGFSLMAQDMGSNLAVGALVRIAIHLIWWVSVMRLLLRPLTGTTFALLLVVSALPALYLGPEPGRHEKTGQIVVAAVNFLALALLQRSARSAIVALALAAFALLAKFNIGVACASAVAAWVTIGIVADRSRSAVLRAIAFVIIGLAFTLALFVWSGGSGSNFNGYIRDSLRFASAYSSSMANPGPWWISVAAVAGIVALIAYFIVVLVRRRTLAGLLFIELPVAFILYKSAIVRVDIPHLWVAFVSGVPLLALPLFWPLGRFEAGGLKAILAVSVLFVFGFRPAAVGPAILSGPYFIWQALTWNSTLARLRAARNEPPGTPQTLSFPPFLNNAPPEIERPVAPLDSADRADVFPNQALLAELFHVSYQPRFAYQAYAAYEPDFDRRAAQNLSASADVQIVLYQDLSLDYVHPFHMSPITMLELLRWYRYERELDSEVLLLRRRRSPALGVIREGSTRQMRSGETLEVAARPEELLLVEAEFTMSVAGRLKSIAYRSLRPTLEVQYQDGESVSGIIGWRNAVSGLIMSNLPRTLAETRDFLQGKPTGRVKSIRLISNDAFHDTIPIRITTIDRLTTNER